MELDHLPIDKFQISIPCVFELGHQLGPNELVWNTNQALVLVLICSPVTLFITQIAIALLPQRHVIHTKTLINWCLVNQILRKTQIYKSKASHGFFLCLSEFTQSSSIWKYNSLIQSTSFWTSNAHEVLSMNEWVFQVNPTLGSILLSTNMTK